jgi:DNA-binding CsgD family transcriptional regulator
MPRPKRIADLTDREREVLDSIRLGLTNEQIAERFNITLAGAKYHVSEILTKLGVSSREQAAAWQPPERPTSWWRRSLALALAAKIIGAAIVVSAIAGVSVLAFGVLRGGSGDDSSGSPGGGTGQASAQVPALSDIFAPGPDFSNKVLHWGVQFYY